MRQVVLVEHNNLAAVSIAGWGCNVTNGITRRRWGSLVATKCLSIGADS